MSDSIFTARAVLQRWRVFVVCLVLGGALATLYLVLAPKWYESELSVVPTELASNSESSVKEKLMNPFGVGSADVQRIRAVLHSNSVTDAVIEKTGLKTRYATGHLEEARKRLWSHCSTSVDRQASVVFLTCEDTDAKKAQEIAVAFSEIGNSVLKRISATSAREERIFLEAQVEKTRQDLEATSLKLKAFQEQHKIISLPDQSTAILSAMASMRGQLISKQLELSYMTTFSSSGQADVQQLRRQIAVTEQHLRELESQSSIGSESGSAATPNKARGGEYFPEAAEVPKLRYELETLMRDQKVQETLFALLTQRYELARIDEARGTSSFQVLDAPSIASSPTRPRRLKIVLTALVLALVAASALTLLPMYLRARRLVEDRQQ